MSLHVVLLDELVMRVSLQLAQTQLIEVATTQVVRVISVCFVATAGYLAQVFLALVTLLLTIIQVGLLTNNIFLQSVIRVHNLN